MISSMTAFARHEQQAEWGVLVWEMRSVNHRYLELQFRLPENLRDLEPSLREKLRSSLKRGKVEVSLYFRPSAGDTGGLKLNLALLENLKSTVAEIASLLPDATPPNPLELLRWPGVLEGVELDYDQVKEAAQNAFNEALQQLSNMRQSEGAALDVLINQRLQGVDDITRQFKAKLPELMGQFEQRFRDRVAAAEVDLEPGRLEQEVVVMLQKADVDEELDRLATHINEVRKTLTSNGAVGRRLDFLMQELNREANTLSSKAIDTDVTQAAVELKVLIEQMREQIQNIE